MSDLKCDVNNYLASRFAMKKIGVYEIVIKN